VIWPGFIQPYDDELFSSWLVRLSRNHRVKSHTFSKVYLQGMPIWNRDIDLLPNELLIDLINRSTSLSLNRIRSLFLHSYLGIIFTDLVNNSAHIGITKIGVYHRKRSCYGLLYCPLCLSTYPYFKKNWRLVTSICCTKCNVFLQDRCWNCNMPVEFHRLEMKSKEEILNHELWVCWKCNSDLRNFIDPVDNDVVLRYQNYIDRTIQQGYNEHANYSFHYFQVLIPLAAKILSMSKNFGRIRNAVQSYFQVEITHNNYFNELKIRREVLLYAFLLLENWPERWLYIIDKYNIRYSDFSKDLRWDVPFWFKKTFITY